VSVAILFLVFFALILLNVPIGYAIIVASLGAMLYLGQGGLAIIQTLQVSAHSSTLLAIPFFVIAGIIMDRGGVTKLMIDFAYAVVGHIRGGLSLVNVMGGILMGGVSGSSVADTASIGSVLLPAMREKKYDMGFSTALTACSGTLGAIIPPSIPLVILGITANVSIGKLFLAGILPGIAFGLAMMGYAYYVARKNNYPTEPRVSGKEVLIRLGKAILPLLTVVIIIAGVVGGVFTATEAGAVACIYALILGMFVYRKISWRDLPDILLSGSKISAAVMLIVVGSSAFGWVLTYEHVPAQLVEIMTGLTDNKILMLLLINIFLLILGTFLDPTPIILLVAPILYPIATATGVDPVQFGIMFVMNMAIGHLTPPVGVVLYTAVGIAKIRVETVVKALLPLWGIMFIVLMLITYVPAFSLTIPNMIMP